MSPMYDTCVAMVRRTFTEEDVLWMDSTCMFESTTRHCDGWRILWTDDSAVTYAKHIARHLNLANLHSATRYFARLTQDNVLKDREPRHMLRFLNHM